MIGDLFIHVTHIVGRDLIEVKHLPVLVHRYATLLA